MSAPNKAIRLGINVVASGRHDAAWKTLDDPASVSTDIDTFVRIAQIAERGKLDALFLSDGPGGLLPEAFTRAWRPLDPLTLHSALSQATRRIGLVVTASSIFGHPYTVARQIASLDHVSKGRAAWNVITSQTPVALAAFGLGKGFEQQERYQRATEFVDIVTSLWDSLPTEAILADAANNVFVDAQQLRSVAFEGQHFSCTGTLAVPVGPQGRPVIFQAGQSEDSKAFGARYADALFTGQRILGSSRRFYADVKGLARSFGRNPDHLLVMPGLFPILGDTEANAYKRKQELDELLDHDQLRQTLARVLALTPDDLPFDAPLPFDKINAVEDRVPLASRWPRKQLIDAARAHGWTVRQLLLQNPTGHRVVVGTPDQIADDILQWVDGQAADGFNLNVDVQTSGLEAIVDQLLPVLRKAGRFREEYTGHTLRDHLGLPAYTAAHALAFSSAQETH